MELKQTTVIEFDYNIETLEKFKAEYSTLDRKDIDKVQGAVKELVKMRGAIQKKGKTYRDDANAFNKMVLSKEKEYVGIIEPLELELKDVLAKEEERKVIEARKDLLPMKKQQLSVLRITQPTDEEILAMNEEEWVAFYNLKFSEHTGVIEREKIAEEEQKLRAEREAQIKKEAEERAEKQREELIKKAEEDKIKAVEEAKKEAEQKALKEKQAREDEERERKEAEDKAKQEEIERSKKLEADQKYQNFLKENNYNSETDIIVNKDGIKIYRLVALYK